MKKTYLQPTMMVVTLQQQSIICTGSDMSRVTGNADLDYGGGGSSPRPQLRRHRLGQRMVTQHVNSTTLINDNYMSYYMVIRVLSLTYNYHQ